MNKNNVIQVFFEKQLVGQLTMHGHNTAFEYDEDWLNNGFPISPFSLPLEKQIFVPSKPYFGGLFGVFADSLPDAWGRLLLDRMLKKYKKNPDDVTVLDRLAIIGDSGMGALRYHPKISFPEEYFTDNLDELAAQCHKILNMEYSEKLDELYRLGGTSGGARPKIAMSDFKLFHSDSCPGYFGTKRFDRVRDTNGMKRVHMLTAAAILELDFQQPSLDYHSLMKLTKILTRNNSFDIENLYRRMWFNVYAHNRDDHSKNFSYLYDSSTDSWRLSPAYDLTFSSTYYGEHTTTIDGNGRNPGKEELIRVGTMAGLSKSVCSDIAEEIKKIVTEMLGCYLS